MYICTYKVTKTLHPGEIRTHDLLFKKWKLLPSIISVKIYVTYVPRLYIFKCKNNNYIESLRVFRPKNLKNFKDETAK
jgi:hypothetical protein